MWKHRGAVAPAVGVALVMGLGTLLVVGRSGAQPAVRAPQFALTEMERAPDAPPELSLAELLRLTARLAPGTTLGTTWVRVTPALPSAAQRGYLFFYRAHSVDPQRAVATFRDDNSHLVFNLHNGGPGKRFLADCAVVHLTGSPPDERRAEPITIKVSDAFGTDTVNQSTTLPEGTGHVTWVVPPSNSPLQRFSLKSENGADWLVTSCKATTL